MNKIKGIFAETLPQKKMKRNSALLLFARQKFVLPAQSPLIAHPLFNFPVPIKLFSKKTKNYSYSFYYYKNRKYFLLIFVFLIIGIFYYLIRQSFPLISTKLKAYQDFAQKIDDEYLIEKLSIILRYSVIEFVFKNQELTQKVIDLICRVIAKETIESFIRDQLTRLLKSEVLLRNAFNLTKEKLLLENVLVDEDVRYKLTLLISRLLKNDSIRLNLVDLIEGILKSSDGLKFTITKLEETFRNEKVQLKFSNEILGNVYESLENKENAIKTKESVYKIKDWKI